MFYINIYIYIYICFSLFPGRLKSFSEYRKEKSHQWKGYCTTNKAKPKKENESKERDVIISIGLMEWREKEERLMAKRGKNSFYGSQICQLQSNYEFSRKINGSNFILTSMMFITKLITPFYTRTQLTLKTLCQVQMRPSVCIDINMRLEKISKG